MLRSGRPSTAKAEYSKASGPSTGCRMCLTASPWGPGTSLSRHIALNSGLSRQSSSTSGSHFRRGAGAGRVHPERAQHEPRHAFPVVLRGAGARVEEDEAQDVALIRRQRSVVDQHHGRRPVPGDDIPCRGPDDGGARVQRVEHALQPRRDAFALAVARLGRAAEAEQEQVLALDVGQHQRARDAIEHVGRGRAAAPLFEPGVPGRADVGALRHFLAAQAGRAATLRGKAERGRIELGAAILQIGSEPVFAW